MFKQPQVLLTGMALALASSVVLADEHMGLEDGFEVTIAGGIASLDQDGTFNWTEAETDSLEQSDESWDSWTATVGIGYVFPIREMEDEDEDEVQFLTTLTPQLNLYYLGGGDIDGDVHRFESPAFNQADYTMDFNSTRLMLDLDLALASYEDFSLYILGGIGIAWNNSDLTVEPKEGQCDSLNLDANDNDNTTFAFEFGAGVDYAFSDDISIYLEYLYADLGDLEISGTSSNGSGGDADDDFNDVVNVDNSDVDMTTQAVLLGLNFAL